MNYINEDKFGVRDVDRDLDSSPQVKRLLKNIDNAEMHTRQAVIEQQAHLINFKRQNLINVQGIRELILKRNKFKNDFAIQLQKTLFSDKYLKAINISGNRIEEYGMKVIIKLGLLDNTSIIAFDSRLNPGCTEKIQRQFALVMLKNIERMKAKGTSIQPEWLVPDLYSFQIPPAILKGLGLRSPGELPKSRRAKSRKVDKRTISLENQSMNVTSEGGINNDFNQIDI